MTRDPADTTEPNAAAGTEAPGAGQVWLVSQALIRALGRSRLSTKMRVDRFEVVVDEVVGVILSAEALDSAELWEMLEAIPGVEPEDLLDFVLRLEQEELEVRLDQLESVSRLSAEDREVVLDAWDPERGEPRRVPGATEPDGPGEDAAVSPGPVHPAGAVPQAREAKGARGSIPGEAGWRQRRIGEIKKRVGKAGQQAPGPGAGGRVKLLLLVAGALGVVLAVALLAGGDRRRVKPVGEPLVLGKAASGIPVLKASHKGGLAYVTLKAGWRSTTNPEKLEDRLMELGNGLRHRRIKRLVVLTPDGKRLYDFSVTF